jgi:aminoglycoside 6'-N-acetyltransferase
MSITVDSACRIARPPEAVVGAIVDPALAPLWNAGLRRFEVVAGEPGEAGAVGRLHYVQGRRSYVMQDRLLLADPGRRYVSEVRGNGIVARVETLLTPLGAGETLVAVRWHGRGTRPWTRLLLPFMRGAVARGAERDLRSLKRLVEGTGRAAQGQPGSQPPAVELTSFVRDRDARLLETWLRKPHVSRWWGDPAETAAEAAEPSAGGGEALITAGGMPVGYVRWQVPTRADLDAAGLHEVPADVVDVDVAIGEAGMLGRGVGSRALSLLCEQLFRGGASTIMSATSVANLRAVRAFEKAGFARRRQFVDTDGETYWLMVAEAARRNGREP